MGKAEALLASLNSEDPDLLPMVPVSPETEEHIVIGLDHSITVPENLKKIAVQYEHNMESVTFDMPRYCDGIDMSKMKIYVNYIRSDNIPGSHLVEDVTVDETDSELIHFTWTINGHVTEVSGNITMLVCARETDSNGKLTNLWSTELNSELYVSPGMKTTSVMVARYPDLVTQLLQRLDESVIYTPSVSAEGILSWTNDRGYPNPDPVSVVGPRGAKGDKGDKGDKGEKGDKGDKGADAEYNLTSSIVSAFNLMRDDKVYTVKYPLWATSQVTTGEKLDDNAGLVCLPSTAAEHRQNDYENLPLFRTYDCNAHVTKAGERIIDHLKGDADFKDTGKNDVFVLGMSYYEKTWVEDGYWYYSRASLPRDGYTLAKECMTPDGEDQGFAVYGKYVCGIIDGVPYSSKGLAPARQANSAPSGKSANVSHNGAISLFKQKGDRYTAGMMCDYKYMTLSSYLMFGTLSSQSVMAGVSNWNAQNLNLVAEANTNRIILTKSQAAYFEVGTYVSIGDNGSSSSAPDRVDWKCHNLAECVKVLGVEAVDENNSAVIVDATFTSTLTTRISTFHWRSGFSDDVKGRTGCPCATTARLTNGKYPIVLNGIEMMVGGYELAGNAIMDIVDAKGKREVYVTDDATKMTSDVAKIKSTYVKLAEAITPTNLNAWNYITSAFIDVENGALIPVNAGQPNSGSNAGFADGLYVDNGTSGQREVLFFGSLGSTGLDGVLCVAAYIALSFAGWNILCRLSINAVGVN